MLIGTQMRLELGGFLIGSSTNVQANIRFSLVQETPTMLTKYVELFYNEFSMFTVTAQAIPTAGSGGITDTIGNPLINTVTNHTVAYTAPSAFFAIIYQLDMISTPSLPNQFVACTRLTTTHVNWCTYLGYPINWIVEYTYLGNFTTAVSSILNLTNGVYSGSFNAVAQCYSYAGLTVLKKTFTITYTPKPISTVNFYSDNATTNVYVYKAD